MIHEVVIRYDDETKNVNLFSCGNGRRDLLIASYGVAVAIRYLKREPLDRADIISKTMNTIITEATNPTVGFRGEILKMHEVVPGAFICNR